MYSVMSAIISNELYHVMDGSHGKPELKHDLMVLCTEIREQSSNWVWISDHLRGRDYHTHVSKNPESTATMLPKPPDWDYCLLRGELNSKSLRTTFFQFHHNRIHTGLFTFQTTRQLTQFETFLSPTDTHLASLSIWPHKTRPCSE